MGTPAAPPGRARVDFESAGKKRDARILADKACAAARVKFRALTWVMVAIRGSDLELPS